MKRSFAIILVLIFFLKGFVMAQNKEVVTIAKQFCHSTTDFFYFETDERLDEKVKLLLSEVFDYHQGTYFISTGTKTIMILPSGSTEDNLSKAAKYFEQTNKYTFAVRGQSRTMFIDNKPIYRFYPYKNTIVFEIFDTK